MKYCRLSSLLIFVSFFSLIIKNYSSDSFLNKKIQSRQNYKLFLDDKIKNIKIVQSKKDFKKFNDNSKYFKKNKEDKEFWKLLKTN